MENIINATYDGRVFIPLEKIDYKPDTKVIISIKKVEDSEYPLKKILALAEDLGITDLSENHDKYSNKKVVGNE